MTLTGGCQCGNVRYEISGDPTEIYICHCLECRKQSASAFGISVGVPRSHFRLTKGSVQSWTRATDSGRQLICHFCPVCGSRLWHASDDGDLDISVKGGSLDVAPDLDAVTHIWTSRKMRGIVIPAGARQFEQEPE